MIIILIGYHDTINYSVCLLNWHFMFRRTIETMSEIKKLIEEKEISVIKKYKSYIAHYTKDINNVYKEV